MARHRQADTRYLELHRGKWRATVAVPRPLHTQLGTRLKHTLNTTSLAAANALKWAVVADLRALIDKAARGNPKADQPADEALSIAAHRAALRDPEAVAQLDEAVADRAEDMRGDPVATEAGEEGRPVYLSMSLSGRSVLRRSLTWLWGALRPSVTTTRLTLPIHTRRPGRRGQPQGYRLPDRMVREGWGASDPGGHHS
jgi:hypothetical protein